MSVYYGVVRGKTVILPDEARLAEGTVVEVRAVAEDRAPPQLPLPEELVKQDLHEAGLLLEIKRPALESCEDDFTPITVTGKPLSETIIEERR